MIRFVFALTVSLALAAGGGDTYAPAGPDTEIGAGGAGGEPPGDGDGGDGEVPTSVTGATPCWANAGPRDNGLDLDDDFVVGEPEDATACDLAGGRLQGAADHEDIDGDGTLEQQWFVVGASRRRHPATAQRMGPLIS